MCFNRTLLSCVQMKRSSRSAWWRLEQTLGTSISLHVQRGGEAESLLLVSGLRARPASCVDSSSVCSSVSSRTNDLCCSSAISCDQLLSATNDHRSECLKRLRFVKHHLNHCRQLPWRQTRHTRITEENYNQVDAERRGAAESTLMNLSISFTFMNVTSRRLITGNTHTRLNSQHDGSSFIITCLCVCVCVCVCSVRLPEEEDVWGAGLPQGHPALQAGQRQLRGVGHADRKWRQGTYGHFVTVLVPESAWVFIYLTAFLTFPPYTCTFRSLYFLTFTVFVGSLGWVLTNAGKNVKKQDSGNKPNNFST